MIFLTQTPHPWRGIRQRPHHLMSRFAGSGHFVRWVEPRYLRWLVDRPGDFFRARAEQPAERLEVRPITLVNGERFAPIRALNQFHLARALNRPLPPGAAGPRILWLYNPHEAHLAERVPHDLLIYDIMDEYQGFPWSPPRVAEEERELLGRADWVFAGTQALFDAKGPMADGRMECILSGVETELFSSPKPNLRVEDELRALRGRHPKLIGYAGMIDLRVDQPLLLQAARAFPNWGFILIGPVAANVNALTERPNIHLVGQREYSDLPAYYHGWDAAMLPFVENQLTRHINPTKMLEYAAAGIPIISRALPDVVQYYSGGAWLYRDPEEFVSHLRAVDAATPETLETRLAIARRWALDRGWDAISKRMLDRVAGPFKR
jgi:UDP-galactopyranose mutase